MKPVIGVSVSEITGRPGDLGHRMVDEVEAEDVRHEAHLDGVLAQQRRGFRGSRASARSGSAIHTWSMPRASTSARSRIGGRRRPGAPAREVAIAARHRRRRSRTDVESRPWRGAQARATVCAERAGADDGDVALVAARAPQRAQAQADATCAARPWSAGSRLAATALTHTREIRVAHLGDEQQRRRRSRRAAAMRRASRAARSARLAPRCGS